MVKQTPVFPLFPSHPLALSFPSVIDEIGSINLSQLNTPMHFKPDYPQIRELISDHDLPGLKNCTVNFINTWGGPELYLQYLKDLQGLFAISDLLNFNDKQRNDLISEYIFLVFSNKRGANDCWPG